MVMFVGQLMEFIFLRFFVLLECPVDDFSNKVLNQIFSNKDIDIINFVRRFQNFIGGILTLCLNIMLD